MTPIMVIKCLNNFMSLWGNPSTREFKNINAFINELDPTGTLRKNTNRENTNREKTTHFTFIYVLFFVLGCGISYYCYNKLT